MQYFEPTELWHSWTASGCICRDPQGGSVLSDPRRGRPNGSTPARKFTVEPPDLLLKKVKLEEAAQSQRSVA